MTASRASSVSLHRPRKDALDPLRPPAFARDRAQQIRRAFHRSQHGRQTFKFRPPRSSAWASSRTSPSSCLDVDVRDRNGLAFQDRLGGERLAGHQRPPGLGGGFRPGIPRPTGRGRRLSGVLPSTCSARSTASSAAVTRSSRRAASLAAAMSRRVWVIVRVASSRAAARTSSRAGRGFLAPARDRPPQPPPRRSPCGHGRTSEAPGPQPPAAGWCAGPRRWIPPAGEAGPAAASRRTARGSPAAGRRSPGRRSPGPDRRNWGPGHPPAARTGADAGVSRTRRASPAPQPPPVVRHRATACLPRWG